VRWAFGFFLLLGFLLLPRLAEACAVCGAADKTLPASGNEIAYEGRFRATVDGRAAGYAARYEPMRVTEVRIIPGVSRSIGDSVMLGVDVPLLRRSIASTDGGADVDRMMLGDVEGRVSFLAYRSSPTGNGRRLTLHGGVKGPTAPPERDAAGRWVPTDLQPGCGSIVPSVGVTYTMTWSLVSWWASSSLALPISVRDGPHPGDSFRASTSVQIQPTTKLAARVGAHGRLDSAGAIGDEVDKRSGGGALYVAPELVFSPTMDLVVSAGASFPMLQGTRGHLATSPIALLGVGYDF